MAMEFVLKKPKELGRPKSLNLIPKWQTRINWIYWGNERYKVFRKSKKRRNILWFSHWKKYQISYLCWLLNVSKSGYYKWIKNGMNEFNKWDTFLC
ncbi:hypothetical protein [Spiroplasma endosymbiont of Lariophagus distinguendus]|uniref:hypothetical protein n=1 Tax=Spiroplasma endosymbiont of Lariophagus distinguendus TaxID=2935082 RepID=UPI00207AC1E3|nr:hypothetical protein [Spiroplasma endosymbiont of Lariophagus distinguendus]